MCPRNSGAGAEHGGGKFQNGAVSGSFNYLTYAATAFRFLVFDYQDPLGGSYLLEALTVVPAFKPLKAVGLAGKLANTYGSIRRAGLKDAHHVIQDAAVRELPGYSRTAAPAVHLPGPSTRVGTPHYIATQVQKQAGGGVYAAERRIGYKALRRAGLSPRDARAAIEQADDYFGSLGVTPQTLLRRPGNRP